MYEFLQACQGLGCHDSGSKRVVFILLARESSACACKVPQERQPDVYGLSYFGTLRLISFPACVNISVLRVRLCCIQMLFSYFRCFKVPLFRQKIRDLVLITSREYTLQYVCTETICK